MWKKCTYPSLFIWFISSFTLSYARVDEEFILRGSSLLSANARFEFLTPALIRLEFSPSESFVDDPTAIVLERYWPSVDLKAYKKGNWLIAETEKLSLHYLLNSGKFTKENLRICWTEKWDEHCWQPGDIDKGNLGGVFRSLDGVGKNKLPQLASGILSRSGYFLLDDSHTPIWDEDAQWITPRLEKDNQDWYFFVYGHDYPRALKAYSELSGKIPMIPRYTLGAWITDLNFEYRIDSEILRNFPYSDKDIKAIVSRFRKENIPLDVLVLDFAWHLSGWTGGYDWSPVFSDPEAFLDWAHLQGLKISLNDHPGAGLYDQDSHAEAVQTALDLPPPPPEPSLYLDLSLSWRFQIDPQEKGLREGWFTSDFDDKVWNTLDATRSWESQGFPDYDGFAWYRKWIVIPENWQNHSTFLMFGGVDDQYDLYVNGQKVAHHGDENNSAWNRITWTEISSLLKFGYQNLIVVRVHDWGAGGGIKKAPVALADQPPAAGIQFNLANRRHAKVFMKLLHHPLVDQGVDFWWVDGAAPADFEELNSQMWTNRIFYEFTEEHTNRRAFIFSRYGGWGSHRYPAFFTGDTYSHWETLAYEIPFTAAGGNVLIPYITHDIGGFLGKKIDFDLYARWLQFGVFSPFLRLHSAHENPVEGNLRMPWTYGQQGMEMVRKFFRLRYSLIPYIYTYCRIAHDRALPLVRPLYLEHPDLEEAYAYPYQYYFGEAFLVSPIVDSTNEKSVYLPPGKWTDFFTGEVYEGGQVFSYECPLDRMPVFVKDGSIIPLAPNMAYSDERPLDTLIVAIYGPRSSEFRLYEDDGVSLEYQQGKYAWTPISFQQLQEGGYEITLGPTEGEYKKQPDDRAYRLKLHGLPKPQSIELNGHFLTPGGKGMEGWRWNEEQSVTDIRLNSVSIRERIKLVMK